MHGVTRAVAAFGWFTAMNAISLLLLFGSLATSSSRTLTVCQAARFGTQLDGKTVLVKGVWLEAFPGAGLFEELVDDKCPEIRVHVVSTPASLPYPPPIGYKQDAKSTEHAQRVAEKALNDGRDLVATIVGIWYVQKKEDYVPARPLNKDVTIPPHHKCYPFVLLIQAVPEIKER